MFRTIRTLFHSVTGGPVVCFQFTEAERELQDWGFKYNKMPSGAMVVKGDINLFAKKLDALPDFSQVTVEGNVIIHCNRLTSLKGVPQNVSGDVYCYNNALTSLEHAPTTFRRLQSDLGNFDSPDEIPERLLISPETRAQRKQEQQARAEEAARCNQDIAAGMPLRQGMKIRGPLRLKGPTPPAA